MRRAAERLVAGWVNAILMLPAIDQAERPRHQPVPCPYCGCKTLWAYVREQRIACIRTGGACTDSDGNQPRGRLVVSRLTGDPCISWADGLVT